LSENAASKPKFPARLKKAVRGAGRAEAEAGSVRLEAYGGLRATANKLHRDQVMNFRP
jgi:hypothetical protein